MLGDLLRQYRQRLGLSQEELAERVAPALSVATIGNIERGRTRPYRHTLLSLCAALEPTAEEQAAAVEAWRERVPSGALSPHTAPEPPSAASFGPAQAEPAASPRGIGVLPLVLTPLVGR